METIDLKSSQSSADEKDKIDRQKYKPPSKEDKGLKHGEITDALGINSMRKSSTRH